VAEEAAREGEENGRITDRIDDGNNAPTTGRVYLATSLTSDQLAAISLQLLN
jgi:hypothetical protein